MKKRFLIMFISLGILSLLSGTALAKVFPQVAFPPGQGCLVCHSDKNLKKDGRSLFIDPKIFHKSVHKEQACAGCHVGFTITGSPHQGSPPDPLRIAALACKNCHPKQYAQYKNSIHGKLAEAGNRKAASCFDCHGNHNIKSFKSEKVRKAFRDSLREGKVCAKCHRDRYESWNDYYLGRAFKEGRFSKAPVCWTCHNNHFVLPAKDPQSTVYRFNLPKTCGQCHVGTSTAFTDGYAPMIHGRAKLYRENFVIKLLARFLPFLRYKDPLATSK